MNTSSSRPRFSAVSFVLSLGIASAALVGCSVGPTDDVYTRDESRTMVGAIARDEVVFPVPIGSDVPNADGRATKLTATMEGVRLRYHQVEVEGTCESSSSSPGEFYYNFGINDRDLAVRSVDRTHSARRDEAFDVNASRIFFVEPDEPFRLHFSASEYDDTFNGGDDHVGSRVVPYTARTLPKRGEWATAPVGHDDCKVYVTYSFERVQ